MQNIPNLTGNENRKRVKRKCVFLRTFATFSLHGNVAILIKLSEMTVNIARLTNNVTFHFLSLV